MVKLTDEQLNEILSALSKNKKNKKKNKKKRKIRKKKALETDNPFFPKKPNFLNRNFGGGGGGFGNFVPFQQQQPVITKVDVLSSDKDNKNNRQMDYFDQQISMIKADNERLREATDKVDTKTNLLVYPLKQIFDVVNNPLSNIRSTNSNFRVQEVDRNDGIGIIPKNEFNATMGIDDQSFVQEVGDEEQEVGDESLTDTKRNWEEQEQKEELIFLDSDDEVATLVKTPTSSPEKMKVEDKQNWNEDDDDEPEAFFEKLQKLEEDRKKRGRPKGSKNKIKNRSSTDEEESVKQKKEKKNKQKTMTDFL